MNYCGRPEEKGGIEVNSPVRKNSRHHEEEGETEAA